jgi:glycolate oxidase iron-sulfur subunit
MSADLLRDADLCVKCGLCLSHCPTYLKTGDENESPRGRIALIQAWAGGHLPASAQLMPHLDNCLLCRSCERVCPAQTPYGRLLDGFRAQTVQLRKDSPALSLAKYAAHSANFRRRIQRLLEAYRTSGLSRLARRLNISGLASVLMLERLADALPQSVAEQLPEIPRPAAGKGRVGLFAGCMGSLFDRESLIAAQRVLTLGGYEVYSPTGQTCCGALDLHSGDKQSAQRLAGQNAAAFAAASLHAVVSVASGCGATLLDYEDRGFAGKVVDISRFLLQNRIPENLPLVPLPAKIIVHTPCSLANVMRDPNSVLQLLRHIPETESIPLPDTIQCCGSAGSYMLDHPAMAQALLDDVLAVIRRHRPRYVVTSNVGCAMHMRAGLKRLGEEIEVLHPVALLNRMLALPLKSPTVRY